MTVFRSALGFFFSAALVGACTATGTKEGTSAADAGSDVRLDLDAQVEAAGPKNCVDPPEIKILRGTTLDPQAPEDQDCDSNDVASANACRFGKCIGWKDPTDSSSHGKCSATCTEVNKQPGQSCWPGAICRAIGNSNYCISTDVPLCSADGGARPSADGGCYRRGVACVFDDDCCSGTCTPSASGAKCE
jgi:hypothetical protein